MTELKNFNQLVDTLIENDYTVIVTKNTHYHHARVFGKSIAASFCSKHDSEVEDASYSHVNGKISADNNQCPDNWRKCPLQLDIPSTEEEMNYLLEQLDYWGSKEGYQYSKTCREDKYIHDYPAFAC